jgi:ankyrin repeat protein
VNRQMVVYLDHPKCNQIFVSISWKQEELLDAVRKNQQKNQVNKDAIKGQQAAAAHPTMPTPPEDPDAALAEMIKAGRNVEVMQRLQSGLDPNYRDSSGNTLLGIAAKEGNVELIKSLLATGKVDINSTDNVGRTPLMHAATSKSIEALRVLIDAKSDIATRDNLGTTALSWAAWLGNAESVNELLEQGSDVEIVSTITGWTPLMLAAAFGDPGAVDALLKVHANVEAVDMLEGATPLIHAARTGQPESLQMLIKAGANLEIPDRNGNTPLLSCAKTSGGDVTKLKILLDAGANVKAKDNRGYNALDLARKRTDARAADIIKLLEPLLAGETPAAASSEPKPAGS